MFLLDTDICIDLTRRKRVPGKHFAQNSPSDVAINTVVAGELLQGVPGSYDPAKTQRDIEFLFRNVTLLPLPQQVAPIYAGLRHLLEGQGRTIGNNDLWIAAHALAFGLTLVTNNEREFRRVPHLSIENWTVSE